MSDAKLPEVSGEPDLDYLGAALGRAGRPVPAGEALQVSALLDGRTGATVQRLAVGDAAYVLKLIEAGSWRLEGMGIPDGGEHRLWLAGVSRRLEGPIRCPVIDVGHEPGRDRYWMLMDDVGAGIRGRGNFSVQDSARLFAGLATMQAPHHGRIEASGLLPPVSAPTRMLRDGVLHLAGRSPHAAPWLSRMVEDFQVVGAFLPVFLEVLGPRLADAYLALAADETWIATLDAEPATLLHGDLRRANIAFESEAIPLFDWEFSACGPAGADLQWHCFLHYWAYPPDGMEAGDDCQALLRGYRAAFDGVAPAPLDPATFERGCALGWLKVLAQIGYALVDPLYPDGADTATTERITALARRAVERGLAFRDALG